MELKTKKKLAVSGLCFAASSAMVAAGIAHDMPVVGLAGFASFVFSGINALDYAKKGISETISSNKMIRKRKKEIAQINKRREQEALENEENGLMM